jgi:hypothetical protein
MYSKSKRESKLLWQYYKFNFLLKGLNLLLKSVGKQLLPSAIPCEDMNVFVYINVIPKCHSLASYGAGIRVLFG